MDQLLALPMQILLFERFFDKNNDSRDTLDTIIQQHEIKTLNMIPYPKKH